MTRRSACPGTAQHRGMQPDGGAGRSPSAPRATWGAASAGLSAELFRDHHQVIAEVPGYLTQAAYRWARRGALRPGSLSAQDREAMFAVIALREIRTSIRDAGLEPPQLPAGAGVG
jgi:hypothetical protein